MNEPFMWGIATGVAALTLLSMPPTERAAWCYRFAEWALSAGEWINVRLRARANAIIAGENVRLESIERFTADIAGSKIEREIERRG